MEPRPADPKVSVCVITYNQKPYIADCLQSILAQKTSFPFEILVGDDCSTDGTSEIVSAFQKAHPHLVFHTRQHINTGGSKNNNLLHASAKGQYVAHVDGDDIVLPGKLQKQADLLDLDLECTATWHKVDFFDDSGNFCSGETADWTSFKNGIVSMKDAVQLGFISTFSSLMYRRSALGPIAPDDDRLDLYWTWDLLSKGHGRVLLEILGRYRVGAQTSLSKSSAQRISKTAIKHAETFVKFRPEYRPDFFLWALSSALVAGKNFRGGPCRDYMAFALRHSSFANIGKMIELLERRRATVVKWRINAARAPLAAESADGLAPPPCHGLPRCNAEEAIGQPRISHQRSSDR